MTARADVRVPLSTSAKSAAFQRAGERCQCSRRDHHHLWGRCLHYLWSIDSARFTDDDASCTVLCARCAAKDAR